MLTETAPASPLAAPPGAAPGPGAGAGAAAGPVAPPRLAPSEVDPDHRPETDPPDRLTVMHTPWVRGTSNPYVRLWVSAVRRAGVDVEPFSTRQAWRRPPSVVHVNWPEVTLRHRRSRDAARDVLKLLASCALVRARGSRIVWTAHNLSSHERRHPWLERLLWRAFCPMVDAVHSLSLAGVDAVRARYPVGRSPVFVVPHGHYADVLTPGTPEEPAYDLGMLGAVRRYKEHGAVLRLLPELAGPAPRVLVAGSASDPQLVAELQATPGAAQVTWALEEHGDEAFQALVQSCRLVVVAQTSALNSGSLLYALSCGRPVLAADTPTFRELQQLVGERWLQLFAPPLTAQRLGEALEAARRLPPGAAPDLASVDWEVLGARAARMYADVAGRSAPVAGSTAA